MSESPKNIPLTQENRKLIKKYVFDMRNLSSCVQFTKVTAPTIRQMLKRGWGSSEHIKLICDYCDKVAGFTTANHAD